MTLLGVGPERAPVPELGLGPERVPEPGPVQVLVPVQARAQVPELVPELVPVLELGQAAVRALAFVAGLALVLSRKREAKCAARCRPEPDWQCC